MRNILLIAEGVISTLMIISILFQSRGSSVGMAFGGTGETYRSKKGIEKVLFYATVVLAALFASVSILLIVVK